MVKIFIEASSFCTKLQLFFRSYLLFAEYKNYPNAGNSVTIHNNDIRKLVKKVLHKNIWHTGAVWLEPIHYIPFYN